ncbi:MAG TPA: M4 family metallopeptidase, partial [Sporichthyaceae bacterium]
MKAPAQLLIGATAVVGLVAAATVPGTALAAAGPAAGPDQSIVRDALTALRDNAARLGFDTDRQGPQSLGKQYRVTATDVMQDPSGAQHVRMDRTFAGLPVLGGDFVVHRAPDGRWVGATATLHRSLDTLNLSPVVDRASALVDAALGTTTSLATALGAPGLVIDTRHGAPALAWDVFTTGTQPEGTPSRLHSFVDAVTGQVRFRDETVETIRDTDGVPPIGNVGSEGSQNLRDQPGVGATNATGKGRSLYAGEVALHTSFLDNVFALKDLTRGGGYTADAEDTADNCLSLALPICTSNAPTKLFTDEDNAWGDGTQRSRQTVAVDAQYGSNMTWDFYKNVFKRAGVANDSVGVYSRVHYGHKYANAFWSDDCQCMTYGDGDGKQLGPLVSLDITGHEITHGVTSRTAKLPNDGESGGLNEANSDIFGTMIEFYAHNAKDVPDYLIGETSFIDAKDKKGDYNAIRYMDDPSRDKSSPDCWNNALNQLDVHLSAGVGDHFFYLLSEGSGKKTINGIKYDSSTCDGKNVTGVGRDVAAKIWYQALTRYFTSGTDYGSARAAVASAATDLFGATS